MELLDTGETGVTRQKGGYSVSNVISTSSWAASLHLQGTTDIRLPHGVPWNCRVYAGHMWSWGG